MLLLRLLYGNWRKRTVEPPFHRSSVSTMETWVNICLVSEGLFFPSSIFIFMKSWNRKYRYEFYPAVSSWFRAAILFKSQRSFSVEIDSHYDPTSDISCLILIWNFSFMCLFYHHKSFTNECYPFSRKLMTLLSVIFI